MVGTKPCGYFPGNVFASRDAAFILGLNVWAGWRGVEFDRLDLWWLPRVCPVPVGYL